MRNSIVCITICFFVFFLLPSIGVMRLDILDANEYMMYRRKKHSRKRRKKIKNEIFCFLAKDETFK